jgi:hypothetical protein
MHQVHSLAASAKGSWQHGPAGSVGIGKKLPKALAKGTESMGDRALAHGPQALKESAAGS